MQQAHQPRNQTQPPLWPRSKQQPPQSCHTCGLARGWSRKSGLLEWLDAGPAEGREGWELNTMLEPLWGLIGVGQLQEPQSLAELGWGGEGGPSALSSEGCAIQPLARPSDRNLAGSAPRESGGCDLCFKCWLSHHTCTVLTVVLSWGGSSPPGLHSVWRVWVVEVELGGWGRWTAPLPRRSCPRVRRAEAGP